ncbi:hypothetical protein F5B18DRAFT_43691 [Nemania serpens]|nr:hypothetical protein F5B18DRAFT_43691 [Nemania serpens]
MHKTLVTIIVFVLLLGFSRAYIYTAVRKDFAIQAYSLSRTRPVNITPCLVLFPKKIHIAPQETLLDFSSFRYPPTNPHKMDKQTPSWLQSYQQPFVKKQNVQCASRHIHQQNMPAAGFVFVRLNASTKLEVLLDLRSKTVADGDTWAFIGGYANDINEDDLAVAYREALEEYGITRDEISLLGLSYKRDHGGIKYLTYTYIFAEYSPADGQAPAPLSHESVRSEWFNLEEGGPTNLNKYIKEDRNMIDHVLKEMVWPMLAEARGLDCANVSPQTPQHDSSAQNQASSPKKPEAPAAKPKTPTSNTSRPVTPRPTVQGNTVARPSTAAQEKAPLTGRDFEK